MLRFHRIHAKPRIFYFASSLLPRSIDDANHNAQVPVTTVKPTAIWRPHLHLTA